ncbi:MAG TPA: hypothetical protein VL688_03885 [Verrucomicrobiae bacterium]|jgi:Skp family chaperone for outer membrane proteins|nr:hypothetical protein [Verrucomicrobiae bacterium]
MKKILILLCLAFPAAAFAAEQPAAPLSIDALHGRVNEIETTWDKAKKDYKTEYQQLIGQVQDTIKQHEATLDNGDTKLRDRLNEERRDLERMRDQIKRKLAEVSGADTISLSKVGENLKDKIEDMKD